MCGIMTGTWAKSPPIRGRIYPATFTDLPVPWPFRGVLRHTLLRSRSADAIGIYTVLWVYLIYIYIPTHRRCNLYWFVIIFFIPRPQSLSNKTSTKPLSDKILCTPNHAKYHFWKEISCG